mmetsp:Transcript_5141/g.11517  ORF Transcript_5141/g.11517 Transcript_5141/m.11517 type:complete len:158 (-) Transcript_5141:267-740(-)
MDFLSSHRFFVSPGVLIEGSFSWWAGWRAYGLASQHREGTYDIIAQVPLVSGRSRIAEGLCEDWMDITEHKIPAAFWKNLDQDEIKLREEKTWRAIRRFGENCARRRAHERMLRQEIGSVYDDSTPISLPHPVPDVVSSSSQLLPSEQAQHLVTDQR